MSITELPGDVRLLPREFLMQFGQYLQGDQISISVLRGGRIIIQINTMVVFIL
jgi:hypothetical protein